MGLPVNQILPHGFEARLIADGVRSAEEALAQQIGTGIELSGRRKDGGMFPLEIMLSLTELNSAKHATLEVVRESGKSLQRIIDDILDFPKIEAGKLEVRPEPTSVARAIEAVRTIYSDNAGERGVMLRCEVDPRISSSLIVDPMRLRQILNNLVSNALKFTAKGCIDIKAELRAHADGMDTVRFSVADTGIGISPANQKLLFQPFVQVASEGTPTAGGTGLGLSICERLHRDPGGKRDDRSADAAHAGEVRRVLAPTACRQTLQVDRVCQPVGQVAYRSNTGRSPHSIGTRAASIPAPSSLN